MILPNVPFFLFLAFLPGVLFVVLGRWSLIYARQFLPAAIVSCAAGMAMLLVTIVCLSMYAFNLVREGESGHVLLVVPLAVYLIVIVFMARTREVNKLRLALISAIGVGPLYFLAAFLALFSACSFGDCL